MEMYREFYFLCIIKYPNEYKCHVLTDQGHIETWLVGPTFTAADVTFAILLQRLVLLGLEDRCFSKDKRPNVFDYYERIKKRKPYQCVEKDELANLFQNASTHL